MDYDTVFFGPFREKVGFILKNGRVPHRIVENNIKEKWCNSCEQWKLLSDFSRDRSTWDSFCYRCKICRRNSANSSYAGTLVKKSFQKRLVSNTEYSLIDGVRTKFCRKCKEWLPLTSFCKDSSRKDCLAWFCKKCDNYLKISNGRKKEFFCSKDLTFNTKKEYNAYYRSENLERIRQKESSYRNSNLDIVHAREKLWRDARKELPNYKLNINMRTGIRRFLKGGKDGHSWKSVVPYSCSDLKSHLEILFEPGMTWENYGKKSGQWSIDHIKPISKFKFSSFTDEEFLRCWSLNNLRPMWHIENCRKNDRWEGD